MALSSTKQELFCEFELDIYASFLVTLFYHIIHMRSCSVAQSCLILCDPVDCSPPGFSVHGILQARYWSQLPFSTPGELPDPEMEAVVLTSPSLVGGFFTTSATCEAHRTHIKIYTVTQNCPSKSIS